MIVFSDLHLKEDTERTVFEQVLPGLFAALSQDADKVLACLGDFFHLRYRVPVHLLNRTAKFLEALERAKIHLIFLPGNHDQVSVDGEHALEVFQRFRNVEVMTNPAWNQYGFWIPYRKRAEDIAAALKFGHETQQGRAPVLWMHHGVQGATIAPGHRDVKGLPPDAFRKWVVLCGHYHIRQQLATVRYIGSPYQTKADEAGQDKGYAIWNPTSFQLEWVTTQWGKRYHNLGLVNGDVDLSAVRPGDEVRMSTGREVDTEALTKALKEAGASFLVTPQVEQSGARLAVAEKAGVHDFAKAYVEQFAGDLNQEQLLALYRSFCE